MINIGHGNFVNEKLVISVVSRECAPSKRMIQDAKENGMLVDATMGRKTLSVIVMNSGHIVTSSATSETLNKRINGGLNNEINL